MKTMFRLMCLWVILVVVWIPAWGATQYVVRFADKVGTPYYLTSPSAFLSARALQNRNMRGVVLAENDLPVNPAYVQAVAATGAQILGRSKWLNAVAVAVSDTTQLIAIQQLPFVLGSQPVNRPIAASVEEKFEVPFDVPFSNRNASMPLDYGASYNQINMIGLDALHGQGFMGQGMLIAVLDAGFPGTDQIPQFDTLRLGGRIAGTWDFVDNTAWVYANNGHGTNTLSCMASYAPGQLVGTAPFASYLLLRTEYAPAETPIEEFFWVCGAEYADSAGADIISSSLGYTDYDNPVYSYVWADLDGQTSTITRGAEIAASKGILVVNSAGNSGGSAWQKIGMPADGEHVLSIGAVDAGGGRASFSSKGLTADGRIKPDVCAQGQGAMIASTGGNVQGANGTSFSCPIIAGAAACLWQTQPTMTPLEVANAIRSSSSQYQSPDSLLGYGIPNFSAAHLILNGGSVPAASESGVLSVFPNPSSDGAFLRFYSADTQQLSLRLINMLGEEVGAQSFFAHAKSYQDVRLQGFEHLAPGVYWVTLLSGNRRFQARVMKS